MTHTPSTSHPASFGEADSTKFRVQNALGSPVQIHQAIVPIVRFRRDGGVAFVGSGFFIAQNIIATAKHVARDCFDRDGSPTGDSICVVQFTPDNQYLFRPLSLGIEKNETDVAILMAMAMNHNQTGAPLTNVTCRIWTTMPRIGEPVFTCAYPKSQIIPGPPHRLDFNTAFYTGDVTDLFPNGRDQVLLPGPCYQTSMVIHGGASGGPVFNQRGCVIGINSTGYDHETLSFVSAIHPLLDLVLPNIKVQGDASPREISIRSLATLGHVDLVDS